MNAPPRHRRPASLTWLAALLVLAGASAAKAQDGAKPELRWTFQPGQTLRYEFHQSSDLKVSANGQSQDRTNNLTIGLSWKVRSVADDGTATIEQTIDRVRAEVKAGDQSILYDSAENTSEGPGASSLAGLYGAALGSPYELKLTPDGRVTEARVPDEVAEALRGSPFQALADGGSVFSSDGLKNMFGQVLPRLPESGREPGESWTGQLELPSGPLLMNLDSEYTRADPEAGAARIASKIHTTIKAKPGVPLTVEVKSQTGEGDYLFDPAAGKLRSTAVKQTFDLALDSMGRKAEQTIAITLSFKALGEAE
jgi:hypothetical protein